MELQNLIVYRSISLKSDTPSHEFVSAVELQAFEFSDGL